MDLYKNIITGLDNGVNLGVFWGDIIVPFFGQRFLLFLPFFFGVSYFLFKTSNNLLQFTSYFLILSLILATVVSFKLGSHPGYFTEWWTVLFISTAVVYKFLSDRIEKAYRYLFSMFICCLLLIKAFVIIHPFYKLMGNENEKGRMMYNNEKIVSDFIKTSLGSNGYVFNNYFNPFSFLNNFLFREAILPQNEIVLFCTYKRKIYDYSDFVKIFDSRKVGFIISKVNIAPPEYIDLKFPHFIFFKKIGDYYIFKNTLVN